MENKEPIDQNENPKVEEKKDGQEKKKVSLADFKVKSFVTNVKVEQMQFLKTAGG